MTTFFTVFGMVGCVFLVGMALMAWWDNRKLKRGRLVEDDFIPFPSQLTPHVPPQWQPTDDDLRDPTPHEPAP